MSFFIQESTFSEALLKCTTDCSLRCVCMCVCVLLVYRCQKDVSTVVQLQCLSSGRDVSVFLSLQSHSLRMCVFVDSGSVSVCVCVDREKALGLWSRPSLRTGLWILGSQTRTRRR